MKKVYYLASTKKEALERAKNDIQGDLIVTPHKYLSKGNNLYLITTK